MCNPLPLMSKGEEKKVTEDRVFYKKPDRGRLGGSIELLVDGLPSMPKGETVGNVVIDGKGNDKEGALETSFKGKKGSRDIRGNRDKERSKVAER